MELILAYLAGLATLLNPCVLPVLPLVAAAALPEDRRAPLWIVIVYILVAIVGFLGWAAAGATIPVVGLLAGAVALAVPLIYGALGGVIGERAGVVNIAIEGQLLAGAFTAAMLSSITRQPLMGLLGAMITASLSRHQPGYSVAERIGKNGTRMDAD